METTWLVRSLTLLASITLFAVILVACDDDLPAVSTRSSPLPPNVSSVAPHLETAGALLDELDEQADPTVAADRMPPPEELTWDPTQGFPSYPVPDGDPAPLVPGSFGTTFSAPLPPSPV